MKYVDASAVLRVLFAEEGSALTLAEGGQLVSSQLVDWGSPVETTSYCAIQDCQ